MHESVVVIVMQRGPLRAREEPRQPEVDMLVTYSSTLGNAYRSGTTFSGQGRVKDILVWDKAQGSGSMVTGHANWEKIVNNMPAGCSTWPSQG